MIWRISFGLCLSSVNRVATRPIRHRIDLLDPWLPSVRARAVVAM
jgi:hypothetical protein